MLQSMGTLVQVECYQEWFTNAILGPLDFIHSEMLKRGMGGSGPSGKQPVETTISGVGPPLGATKGYLYNTYIYIYIVGYTPIIVMFMGVLNDEIINPEAMWAAYF